MASIPESCWRIDPSLAGHWARGCAVATIALMLAGCTGADLALYPPGPVPGALLVGELTMESSCLFVVADDGTKYGLVWPAGITAWHSISSTIEVAGSSAAVGERVTVGGGPYDITPKNIEDYPWVRAPSPECLGDQLFFVASLGSTPVQP